MKPPALPANEAERHAALCRLNILDTPNEDRFDRVTRIAQRYFGTDIVLVSIVDSDRQWFKSRQGLDATETPRDISFCGHAILGEDIFYVPNALEDPRFADNPLVTSPPNIRFYAGAPLHAPGGERVGTLCIIDDESRDLSAEDLSVLRDLADTVEAELERTYLLEAETSARRLALVAKYTDNSVIITDADGCVEWVNDGFERITGYTLDEVIGTPPGSILQGPETNPSTVAFMSEKLSKGEGFFTEILNYTKQGERYWLALDVRPVSNDQGEVVNFIAIESEITERRLIDEEQRRLAAIVGSSDDAIISKNLDGIITSWNPAAEKIFGYSAEETIGQPMAMLVPPERADEEPKILAKLRQGEKVDHFETVRVRKDGGLIDVSVSISPIQGRDGSIIGASKIARDITERNRQQKALEQSLELLEIVQKTQLRFIREQDPSKIFSELLDDLLRITKSEYGFIGELRHTPEGQPFIKAYGITNIAWDDQNQRFYEDNAPTGLELHKLDNFFGSVVLTGETILTNEPAKDPRSTGLPKGPPKLDAFLGIPFFHGSETIGMLAIANRTGGYDQAIADFLRPLIGASANILGAYRTERTLKDREKRMSAVLETVVDGIVTINNNGTIETFNPAAMRIFGYKAEETVGHNVKMLMPEPYHTEHDGYLQNFHEGGEAKVIGIGREVIGQRKDGSTFPMELAVSEMEVGGVQMFTGIVRDITDRKQAETMKTEFISTVSHELRTPLTSIKGSLGLIKSGAIGELPDKLKSMLEIAYNNSDRLVRLINDILDIEKIAAGKMDFQMVPMELGSLLEQAIDANKGYGGEHGVSFVLSSDLPEAKVDGDHDRLMQVLANLMSNAAKFSPKGDTVTISLSRHDTGYRVAVADCGPGIQENFRDKIFGRFHQADSSDTRSKGGTGLGLNITKAIVEQHGGTIGFETEVGKGTTFFFDLPELQERQDVRGSASAETPQYHVLICEDEPDIVTLLELMLKNDGFTTDTASNAAEAEDLLSKNTYDAMTLDLGLPDKDGITLLRELREKPETRDLPIIVISAKATEGSKEINGDAIGVIDWIEKPIDQDRLSEGLRRAVTSSFNGKVIILHVEDDPDILQIVSTLVDDLAEIVSAKTLSEAKSLLQQQRFDLVVLDLMLPDGDGEDLLPLLKGDNHKSTPVIVFSAKDISEQTADNIKAVLVKSRTSNESLLATIRSSIEASKSTNKRKT